MKTSYGRHYLTPKRLVELLSPLEDHVRIMPTNRELTFFDEQDTPIGGLSFEGDGEIDWHGPE